MFTPGGRKLPPLGLSPGGNPETPGHMWLSLLNATNGSNQDRNKTGLTPNELNLRLGLTPGVMNQNGAGFPFPPGMTTPLGMINNPMTPGLLLLLGLPTGMPPAPEEKAESHLSDTPAKSELDQQQENDKKRAAPQLLTETKKKPRKQKKQLEEPKDKMEGNDDDEKRRNFLERNRVAALKCRQRKKQLIQKMEDELTFYSTGYRELSAQVTQLREQLIKVNQVLAAHKDCQLLAQQVGGFDHLNQLLTQSQYVTQLAAGNQGNVTLIPLTIPTTLNSVPMAGAQAATQTSAANTMTAVPPPPPNAQPQYQPGMPGMMELGVPRLAVMAAATDNQQTVTSHGSMTDLQAVGNEQGDLRNIQLMLNLQRAGELEGLTLDMGMVQPNN